MKNINEGYLASMNERIKHFLLSESHADTHFVMVKPKLNEGEGKEEPARLRMKKCKVVVEGSELSFYSEVLIEIHNFTTGFKFKHEVTYTPVSPDKWYKIDEDLAWHILKSYGAVSYKYFAEYFAE